jgi:hypothetical protein
MERGEGGGILVKMEEGCTWEYGERMKKTGTYLIGI